MNTVGLLASVMLHRRGYIAVLNAEMEQRMRMFEHLLKR